MKTLASTRFSILDLVPYHENKTIAQALRASRQYAQAAERLGYTRFWVAEHHSIEGISSAATSVVIGYLAEGTSKIRVGSGGIMLPNHAPIVVAEQFGTLESLYPGRIDLGLGRAPGSDRLTMLAMRRGTDLRGAEFDELIERARLLFRRARARTKGKGDPGRGLECADVHSRFVALQRSPRRKDRPALCICGALRLRNRCSKLSRSTAVNFNLRNI